MGLIARACEAAGLSTCCLVLVREVAQKVRPPRALYLKWPFGSPLGEPGHVAQQRRVLLDMLTAVAGITEPGTILDLPYRWRREDYDRLDGLRLGADLPPPEPAAGP